MRTTTTIDEIISEASRLGVAIALAPDGCLEVFPADRVPRDFLAAVRERKAELRACLEARAPWLHAAKQILIRFDSSIPVSHVALIVGLPPR